MDLGVEDVGEHMGRKPATYADLEALPANLLGEIVGGELHVSPRPAAPHAVATSRLASRLIGPFDLGEGGPGGWLILFEPELHLEEDVLIPDLAGWRRTRLPEAPRTAAFTLPPDWVCEVLSPSTEALARGSKLSVYAREGVRHVWLVNPEVRTLEVLRLEGSRYLLLGVHTGEAHVRAEPFGELELALGLLWRG
jgi:hypothetical protein